MLENNGGKEAGAVRQQDGKIVMRGELALLIVVFINSMGVVLMLHSGSGLSAISSVPYAFSLVLPGLSLGTWTYLFQGLLVLTLMLLRRKVVFSYLFSFVVGFVFGNLVDLHELWIAHLSQTLPVHVLCYLAGYLLIGVGVALSNRCKLPIIPTDLFPRELSFLLGGHYAVVKISFDVLCLAVTALMTGLFLGRVTGLGVGTIIAALTMGKAIGWIGARLDRRLCFVSVLEPEI